MALYTTPNPLADALEAILGITAPDYCQGIVNVSELADEEMLALCDWASGNARPIWATGESIVDAADLMVTRAFENDNL